MLIVLELCLLPLFLLFAVQLTLQPSSCFTHSKDGLSWATRHSDRREDASEERNMFFNRRSSALFTSVNNQAVQTLHCYTISFNQRSVAVSIRMTLPPPAGDDASFSTWHDHPPFMTPSTDRNNVSIPLAQEPPR